MIIAQCGQCGYKLPVIFPTAVEMQEALKAVGWICVQIKGTWLIICPTCRKENNHASP